MRYGRNMTSGIYFHPSSTTVRQALKICLSPGKSVIWGTGLSRGFRLQLRRPTYLASRYRSRRQTR